MNSTQKKNEMPNLSFIRDSGAELNPVNLDYSDILCYKFEERLQEANTFSERNFLNQHRNRIF